MAAGFVTADLREDFEAACDRSCSRYRSSAASRSSVLAPCWCVAFISSTWLAYWRARREQLDPEVIGDMSFWVFLFGLIGARLFYCIEYWGDGYQEPLGRRAVLEGGRRLLRRDRRRSGRVFLLLEAAAVSHAPLHGCAGAVDRHRDAVRPPGLFLEWVLFWRHLPASLGGLVSRCIRLRGSSISDLGLIPPDAPYSLPVHPTQIYSAIDASGALPAADGLLSAPPARRRGDRALDADLSDLAVRDRVSAERRGRFFAGMTISQTISVAAVPGRLRLLGLAVDSARKSFTAIMLPASERAGGDCRVAAARS